MYHVILLIIHSLGSPLCVLYKPNLVAAAALLLASHFTTSEKLNENWYESLQDVDASEMHGKNDGFYCNKN